MTAVASAKTYIQEEEVEYNSPLSEALDTNMGAAINYLNDRDSVSTIDKITNYTLPCEKVELKTSTASTTISPETYFYKTYVYTQEAVGAYSITINGLKSGRRYLFEFVGSIFLAGAGETVTASTTGMLRNRTQSQTVLDDGGSFELVSSLLGDQVCISDSASVTFTCTNGVMLDAAYIIVREAF